MKLLDEKIKEFKREVLQGLFNQCSEKQQIGFIKKFGSVESVPEEIIEDVIRLCERSIINNT